MTARSLNSRGAESGKDLLCGVRTDIARDVRHFAKKFSKGTVFPLARNIHALMREKENGFSAVPFFHAIFTAFAVFRVIVFVIICGFLVRFLFACAAFLTAMAF